MFKLDWVRNEIEKTGIRSKLNDLLETNKNKEPVKSPESQNMLPHAKFFEYLDQNNNAREMDSIDEFFQGALTDDLRTVMQNIQLKTAFIRYNTVLPSSAPVERLFSIASLILSSKRFCLTDELFEKLLFLKTNKKFRTLDR